MCGFVGVVDSGVGGLTVLRQLQKVAPQHNYVYIADHAFCPYGIKPLDQIFARVLHICRFLTQNGATALVLACNTASVFAAELRKAVHVPLFDVVAPTCAEIAFTTQNKRVALLATNATVKSGIYQRILQKYGVVTVAFACSNFVSLVENNAPAWQKEQCVQKVTEKVLLTNADTLVLGCTHFPYLLKEISHCAPNVQIVSCAKPLAKVFAASKLACGSGKTFCFTTDSASVAFASRFANVNFLPISL